MFEMQIQGKLKMLPKGEVRALSLQGAYLKYVWVSTWSGIFL